ncbi:MFS transporter [uncultured archaeon]|nr:MFS transporter [uncultured archaeon]
MVHYKWVALSNTTMGVFMATINQTILLIALPDIFRGIGLNPFVAGNFQYLLWILLGFNIVTATLLLTFGRLSDMFGRIKLFNMGFAIFTAGSIMLYFTPWQGPPAAQYMIVGRLIQGFGAAFLFSNSAAILTDAFPSRERGTALGINSIAAIGGSFIGIILGGVLAVYDWRYVFLVSVPVGALGTVWSYLKLKDTSKRDRTQKIDYIGNVLFAGGLTLILVGIIYGLLPYGNSTMGWQNPLVLASFAIGAASMIAFPFVEMKVKFPMFRMSLFRIRAFSMGNIAGLLSAMARGGVMIMLIILLQGIYLPLKGYDFAVTPFWAGIYMVPLTAGFMLMSPIGGKLSDKYGAKFLATVGMVIVLGSFYALTTLPYLFYYPWFAIMLFTMGVGNGMFAAPNAAAIMNSVPAETRGASSGMRATLMNAGMTVSIGLFFTVVIVALSSGLPSAFSTSLTNAGAPELTKYFNNIPPTAAMFSAFLGINPVSTIIGSLSPAVASHISSSTLTLLTSKTWFPHAIAPAFMSALHIAFFIGMLLAGIAAATSYMRGGIYIHEDVVTPQGNEKDDGEVERLKAGEYVHSPEGSEEEATREGERTSGSDTVD